MKKIRTLKSQLVLQIAIIALPMIAILLYQTVSDIYHAEGLERSYRRLAACQAIKLKYAQFVNGAVDAVDAGQLGSDALRALDEAAEKLKDLAQEDHARNFVKLTGEMNYALTALKRDRSISTLLQLRALINQMDVELRYEYAHYEKENRQTIETYITFTKMQTKIVSGALFVVFVGFFMAFLVFRKIIGSVHACMDFAGRITRGDLGNRMALAGGEEFQSLATSLNSMSEALQSARFIEEKRAAELAEANEALKSEITEHRRAEEEIVGHHVELERMNAELKTLHDISEAISQTLEMDEILSGVLGALVRTGIFPFEIRGGIYLVEQGRIRLASFVSLSETELEPCQEVYSSKCLCGLAVTTGEVAVSKSSHNDSRHAVVCHPASVLHGHIVVPLKVVQEVVGLLSLYTGPEIEVSEDMLSLLRAIGSQVGIAINNARLYEQTISISLHDPLTGLANRRFLQIQLEKSFEAAKRYQEKLSVIMLDIDHFKNYNDARGHVEGDRLLARLAEVLVKELRNADYVFRYGGEEFLCMLPETDLALGCEVAERLRMAVQEETDVTISLGIASFMDYMPDKETLVKKADEALYRAKENGRNRVERSVE